MTIVSDSLRIPGVTVELRNADANIRVGQTISDAVGQVTFPDVPPGNYIVQAVRDGFADSVSGHFTIDPGETHHVLVEMRLTFVRESVEVVVPANSPTESLQPVAVSDVLTGAKMDIQPLAGDDFQSLLTMLPSVIRGPEGRLRLKGGTPTTGALQVSSASLNDPSTGDFDLELPSGAVESVEVLSNPFAAEYGRFSTSVTQVRTKRGTNEWIIKPDNLVPGFGKGFAFVDKFEPRLSISGPLKRDKLLFGEYLQYRFVRTEVKSLPGKPQIGLDSFDSFTRLDSIISSRHALTLGVIYFPRKITNATLSTFRPPETTPRFTQSGLSAGAVDRLILSSNAVLESTLAVRRFEVDQKTQGDLPMVYSPQTQSGNFFSRQERNVHSYQAVEALSMSKDHLAGDHVFKFGVDLQHSGFDGDSFSQELDVVRLDGSLAERTTYSPDLTHPDVSGTEFAVFAQDRWRVSDRLMFELGMRADRDDVVERVNYSPRAGAAVSLLPEGRGILRGGFGKFAERTPLTVGAFGQYEVQTVTRFAADGTPLGPPVTLVHAIGELKTPESLVQTVAWDQRVGRKYLLQGRVPAPQRLALGDSRSGSRQRRVDAGVNRRVEVLGARDDGPVSRERAQGPDGVVRALAQYPRSQRLRSVLRQLQESNYPRERELAEPDRRAESNDRARHDRPAGQVGHHASLRMAQRVSLVGGQRVPGLCRSAKRVRAAPKCQLARFFARASLEGLEVPIYRGHQDLQRLQPRQRTGRAHEHHVTRLRQVLQSHSAVDRIRDFREQALRSSDSWSGATANGG